MGYCGVLQPMQPTPVTELCWKVFKGILRRFLAMFKRYRLRLQVVRTFKTNYRLLITGDIFPSPATRTQLPQR